MYPKLETEQRASSVHAPVFLQDGVWNGDSAPAAIAADQGSGVLSCGCCSSANLIAATWWNKTLLLWVLLLLLRPG